LNISLSKMSINLFNGIVDSFDASVLSWRTGHLLDPFMRASSAVAFPAAVAGALADPVAGPAAGGATLGSSWASSL